MGQGLPTDQGVAQGKGQSPTVMGLPPVVATLGSAPCAACVCVCVCVCVCGARWGWGAGWAFSPHKALEVWGPQGAGGEPGLSLGQYLATSEGLAKSGEGALTHLPFLTGS